MNVILIVINNRVYNYKLPLTKSIKTTPINQSTPTNTVLAGVLVFYFVKLNWSR